MNRKLILIILFVLTVAVSAVAEDFIVDYVEGYLDLKGGGSWSEVYIGDELPMNAVVKLDQDSYAEISMGGDTIKLSRAGIYELKKLIEARTEVKSSGMGSLISGKFKTLVKEDTTRTQSAVGGVRAAEAETVTVDWLSSETAEMIADGRDALDAGNLEEALSLFTDAYDFAADMYEESEALYFIGLTYAVDGKYDDALKNLDKIEMDTDSEYYLDFYLLKGQLLVESFAYREAYNLLSEFDESAGQRYKDKLQELYFLKAVAANNYGNTSGANTALNKVIALDSGSETAKAARAYKSKL